MRRRVVAGLVVGFLATTASSQEGAWKDRFKKLNVFASAPRVYVTLQHAPLLGFEIDSAAFAPPVGGKCADELVDLLISDFVSSGVTLTDRAHLEEILGEHEFSLSGLVDRRENAAEIGQILGATAMVFVNVRRCETDEQMYRNPGRDYVEYTAETTGVLRGTLQVVDLATAKLSTSRQISQDAKRTATSRTGRPAQPSTNSVIDEMLRDAREYVHRMFFPWREDRGINFFNESQCNLRHAYRLMQQGDIEAAVTQSKDNTEFCDSFRATKPKLVAKAYYNLGISYLMQNDFNGAQGALEDARSLNPSDLIAEGIDEVERTRAIVQRRERATAAGLMTPGTENDTPAAAPGRTERADVGRSTAERLNRLRELFDEGLITKDIYRKRATTIVSESGPPGETMEEQLRNLKALFEEELLSQEVYEKEVADLIGKL